MRSAIERASVSFRIGVPQWLPDDRFEQLVRLFEKYRHVTSEVTFFTSETHPPLPLGTIEQRVAALARRMPVVRSLRCRAGINVLATIGHHNENLPGSLAGDYVRLTDLDGEVCLGSFCPNDEGMRDYVARLYRLVASADPDYLWIDDDVRLFGHKPILAGCFCDVCLARFEQACGTRYTRDSLGKALDTGPVETKLAVRRAWLRHNRDTIGRLLTLIERSVHELKPGLPLGFMTGDRFYEGYDFDRWAEILAGPDGAEVMWRPGGGNYTDERLDGIAEKAHCIGRQTALLPGSVVSIQSEVESFPYQRLRKSVHATVLEAACYIAGGCTGAAFNVLSAYDEPLDEYEPLVRGLEKARPLLDLLARALGRSKPIGVYSGWCKDTFAARNLSGPWFARDGAPPETGHAEELLAIGLPAAYSDSQARVTALSGDGVLALNEQQILDALTGGVYMDAGALRRLNERGHQDLTGFAVERIEDCDCIEQLTADTLNGVFSGRRRDGRQSFWRCPAYGLGCTDEGARVLARLVDYGAREVAACGMGVFENRLGGRVCVAGYYPWTQLQSLSKSAQLKSVVRWLSKDTLPAYVASFHRVNLWVRAPADAALAIALVNASLDVADHLVLLARTDREQVRVYDMQCSETEIRASGSDGAYKAFELPSVGAWEVRLVTA